MKNLIKSDKKNTLYIDFNDVVIVSLKEKKEKDRQEKNKQKTKDKKDKKSAFPIIENNNNFPSKPLLILTLVLLSSIVAFFSWKTSNFKTVISN